MVFKRKEPKPVEEEYDDDELEEEYDIRSKKAVKRKVVEEPVEDEEEEDEEEEEEPSRYQKPVEPKRVNNLGRITYFNQESREGLVDAKTGKFYCDNVWQMLALIFNNQQEIKEKLNLLLD